jgi:hypothetical protein
MKKLLALMILIAGCAAQSPTSGETNQASTVSTQTEQALQDRLSEAALKAASDLTIIEGEATTDYCGHEGTGGPVYCCYDIDAPCGFISCCCSVDNGCTCDYANACRGGGDGGGDGGNGNSPPQEP